MKGSVGVARSLLLLVSCAAFAASCRANDKLWLPDAPAPSLAARFPQGVSQPPGESQHGPVRGMGEYHHRFWDRENILLFSLVGTSRALDYSSTLNMRRRGRQEVFLTNDIVDNHAAFAAIEAGGTAISIGASYLFHRYHHHRLERWTSVVHASLATSGAIRNYCLKTAHPSSTP
jgi:hypothetical protein